MRTPAAYGRSEEQLVRLETVIRQSCPSRHAFERARVAMSCRCAFIGAALTVLSGCGQPDDAGVRFKLRGESTASGVALAAANAGDIQVIPFNRQAEHFRSAHRSAISTFGKAGRMILWWSRADFLDMRGDFVVDSIEGDRIAEGRPTLSGFNPVALSEAAGRIAFLSTRGSANGRTGLYSAPFDFANVTFIAEAAGDADWSPDGQTLAYEKDRQIYTFDIAKSSSRALGPGQKPTWSPNGKWISFINLGGDASLVTAQGVPVSWPLTDHRPISSIRWSPDGSYVCFAEALPAWYVLLDAASRLVVCRVSDGREITVSLFNNESVDYASFQWIVDYPRFLGGLKR